MRMIESSMITGVDDAFRVGSGLGWEYTKDRLMEKLGIDITFLAEQNKQMSE